MELTKDEQASIEHLRTLSFEEILDATFAMDSVMTKMIRLKLERNAHNIIILSTLISNASENYKEKASILDQD